MAKRRKRTITLPSGLKLEFVDGLYVPVLPPDTPILTTAKLLEAERMTEEEEGLRTRGLTQHIPGSKH
jgi:hypothetical protein